MHCFCCDKLIDPNKAFDPETGRYYCSECFEATNEVKLSYLLDDLLDGLEYDNVLDPLIDNSEHEDIFEYEQRHDFWEDREIDEF